MLGRVVPFAPEGRLVRRFDGSTVDSSDATQVKGAILHQASVPKSEAPAWHLRNFCPAQGIVRSLVKLVFRFR